MANTIRPVHRNSPRVRQNRRQQGVRAVSVRPIHNEKDYLRTLERVDKLWGSKKGTPNGDEFEILVTLVEAYEEKQYHIPLPTPIEAIKFRMEQMELTPTDLAKYLGSRSRVSEILSGKRQLTIKMMRTLHRDLGIPVESLLGN
jgi:HTH-type transcriptional regulator/antitoxin HigA